jgi:hypothetical protein
VMWFNKCSDIQIGIPKDLSHLPFLVPCSLASMSCIIDVKQLRATLRKPRKQELGRYMMR